MSETFEEIIIILEKGQYHSPKVVVNYSQSWTITLLRMLYIFLKD